MKRTPLKPGTTLTRRTPLRSRASLTPDKPMMKRTRVKPVNRKRAAKMDARNFGQEAERVRAMPCLCAHQDARAFFVELQASFAAGEGDAVIICRGSVVAAHVTARGMGASKGGRFDLVPLCDAHHREAGEAETSQRAAFEQRYGLDLRAEADAVALEHPRPLGIRGLADRWVAWRRYWVARQAHESGDGPQPATPEGRPLDSYETDALLGWVRRRMARDGQALEVIDFIRMTHDIASALGFIDADGDSDTELADALCESAGWPS